jgi:RNA polymerase sigma-70 factor (ECF subfamily)
LHPHRRPPVRRCPRRDGDAGHAPVTAQAYTELIVTTPPARALAHTGRHQRCEDAQRGVEYRRQAAAGLGPDGEGAVTPIAETDAAARFAAGHPDGVRMVYEQYGRLVFAIAYKLLGNRSLAEEATQQTFVSAWRASAAFDPARELGPWLATIARRCAIDIHRREARRSTDVDLAAVDPSAPELVTMPASIESAYEVWEVRRVLEELSPEDREMVRLSHFDGLSHPEIADRLGVPVGTVKSRSFRAHRRLAGLLGHLREDPPEPTPSTARPS